MQTDSLRSLIANQLEIDGLRLVLKPEFASNRPDHRLKIREHLIANLDCGPDVLDLDSLPRAEHSTISISHNREVGGYVSAPRGIRVGFDVEVSGRVTEKNMRRVCVSDDELARAPGADLLWAAKEAAFKSLGPGQQPQVFSEIEIGDWSEIGLDTYLCRVLNVRGQRLPNTVRGLALRWKDEILASASQQTLAVFRSEDECVGS